MEVTIETALTHKQLWDEMVHCLSDYTANGCSLYCNPEDCLLADCEGYYCISAVLSAYDTQKMLLHIGSYLGANAGKEVFIDIDTEDYGDTEYIVSIAKYGIFIEPMKKPTRDKPVTHDCAVLYVNMGGNGETKGYPNIFCCNTIGFTLKE